MELTPELEALMHARSLYMGTQEPQVTEQAPAEFAGAAEVVPPQVTTTETQLTPPAPVAPQPPLKSVSMGARQSGSQSTTRTVRRNDIPPAPQADFDPLVQEHRRLQANVEDVRQDRQDTLQDRADAETGIADVEASTLMRESAAAENHARLEAQLSGNRDARVAQKQAEIEQRMAEIPAVDPGRMWKNAGALGSAAGIISAAIGGYLAVRQGRGGNDALDQINKVIEQDVHAQEQDIWNQKYKLGLLKDQKDDIYKDAALKKAERAEQFAYRKMSIASEMGVHAAKFKSASKQAEYLDMQLKLQEEAFKDSQESLKFYSEVYSKNATRALQAYQAEEQLKLSKESNSIGWMNAKTARMGETRQANATKELEAAPILIHPNTKERFVVDPRRAGKMTPAQYEEFDKQTASRYDIADRGRRIAQRIQEIGGATFGPGVKWKGISNSQKAELDAMYTDLRDLVGRARSGANMPEGEIVRMEQILGSRETWFTQDPSGKLRTFFESVGGDQQRRANQLGLRREDGTEHNWRGDFDMPKFKSATPTTAKSLTESIGENTEAIMNGVGGESTALDITTKALAAYEQVTADSGVYRNPREAVSTLSQLTVTAKQLKAAGHDAAADQVARVASDLNKQIAARNEQNKRMREQQGLPPKPGVAIPEERLYSPETYVPASE